MTRPVSRSIRNFILLVLAAATLAITAAWLRPPPSAPVLTLVSLEGRRIALQELRGKVVLVNFWATSCSVCLHEMPQMAETYRRYRSQGLDAIFVAMPYDRPDHVLAYARAAQLPFPVALDVQGEAARAFGGIHGTPTTFLIDKRGRIVERILGESPFERLHALIERRLAEPIPTDRVAGNHRSPG